MYGGLSAAERRAARRARLLDAAFDLFGTKGYASTTIEEFCSAAGVTARHFYEEFETREALLAAVYDRTAEQLLVRVRRAIFAPGASVTEVVAGGARAFVEFVTGDPRRPRVLFLEVVGVSPALEEHRRIILREFGVQTTIAAQRFRAAGLGGTVDYELLSVALNGAAMELAIQWVLSHRKPEPATLIKLLTHLWMRSLELEDVADVVAS